jgi:hypothetical protein
VGCPFRGGMFPAERHQCVSTLHPDSSDSSASFIAS